MKLKLTDTERLMLANQYEILGKLEEDQGYLELAHNLRRGYEYLYQDAFQNLYEVMPQQDAQFVMTIVGLYDNLQASYSQLADKGDIDPAKLKFPGFDGNSDEEVLLMGFASALAQAGFFPNQLRGRIGINSHMSLMPNYRRMIAAWKELGEPHNLSQAQIETVLKAKNHPE